MDDKGNVGNQAQPDHRQTQVICSQQPVSQPQSQLPVQQVPLAGSINKEAGPVVIQDVSEILKPTEPEQNIQEEVLEAGVEKVSDKPNLTPEHAKFGIELAKESTPVSTTPSGIVKLPMTEEEAIKNIKIHKKITDSARWYIWLILKQFKIMRSKVADS